MMNSFSPHTTLSIAPLMREEVLRKIARMDAEAGKLGADGRAVAVAAAVVLAVAEGLD